MPHAGQQIKDEMIHETARMMAEQDALRRPAHQLMARAAEIVDEQIKKGIYADPLAKYDMSGMVRRILAE